MFDYLPLTALIENQVRSRVLVASSARIAPAETHAMSPCGSRSHGGTGLCSLLFCRQPLSFVSCLQPSALPLCYPPVLKIFCLHGGLSPTLDTLDHIRALDRVQASGPFVCGKNHLLAAEQ